MKLDQLLRHLDYTEISGQSDLVVAGISYDSRKVGKDYVFVAIAGANFDGANFIEPAIKGGAKVIVYSALPSDFSFDVGICYIKVDNARIALAQLSHAFFEFPANDLKIYGVTGTNGKTTVTYILKSILEEAGEKVGLIGTTGNYIGQEVLNATHTTPESLELAELFHKMKVSGVSSVVMEVSSHALALERVNCVKFDSAIFMNLTHDHLDFHGTMQNYAEAKRKLFSYLKPNGVAVVNADDYYAGFMLDGTKEGITNTFGRSKKADCKIENEKVGFDSTSFKLNCSESVHSFQTKLLGRFNIDNLTASIVATLGQNIPFEAIQRAVSKTNGAPGRMQRTNLKSGAIAIVDYAHTPDALDNALLASRLLLQESKSQGRLICVFGCGGDRDTAKRPIMGRIAHSLSDLTIVTSDNPRTEDPNFIIDDIIKGIETEMNLLRILDRRDAIHSACKMSEKGDIIFIAGKGHETYQIIGKARFHFDDNEEVAKFA